MLGSDLPSAEDMVEMVELLAQPFSAEDMVGLLVEPRLGLLGDLALLEDERVRLEE